MKYNFIFIVADGVRVDMLNSCPFLKNLLDKSIFFDNMITYAPSTIASMYTLFSGTYGSENGVNNYWASSKFKNNLYKTMAQYFQMNDYVTKGDTINELAAPKFGFDKLTIHNEYTDNLIELHSRLIRNLAKSQKKILFVFAL